MTLTPERIEAARVKARARVIEGSYYTHTHLTEDDFLACRSNEAPCVIGHQMNAALDVLVSLERAEAGGWQYSTPAEAELLRLVEEVERWRPRIWSSE
jgi:hypothetical protein